MKIFLNIIVCVFCVICLSACTNIKTQLSNPWFDCQDNLKQAAKLAGFNFPLALSNYTVRAMKNMIEITYPLDDKRSVTVRKSEIKINDGDISGDYNIYPINKVIILKNGVKMNARGNSKLIYTANFGAEQGYYSISCNEGLTIDEIYKIYEIIAKAEAPKMLPDVAQ